MPQPLGLGHNIRCEGISLCGEIKVVGHGQIVEFPVALRGAQRSGGGWKRRVVDLACILLSLAAAGALAGVIQAAAVMSSLTSASTMKLHVAWAPRDAGRPAQPSGSSPFFPR
jgi:hypothetical protein